MLRIHVGLSDTWKLHYYITALQIPTV